MLTLGLKMVFAASAFTSITMMVATAAEGEHLGTINGINQAIGSLARTIGPTLGGFIWSWSLTLPFALRNEAVYLLMAASAAFSWALSFRFPAFLNV